MPASLATLLIGSFTFWLFRQDAKERPRVSSAVWIPFLWAFVIGTKPVSIWLGLGNAESIDGYQDSIIDKLLFFFLVIAGWMVLRKRQVNWRHVFASNRVLLIYFIYLAMSGLWAEDPITAWKRWFKDAGNIIMALVLLTEEEPMEAIKSFLARCAYLLVPLAVLVIKYYPEQSRRYDMWDNKVIFLGICTDKNMFGMTMFVCGLSLFWLLLEALQTPKSRENRINQLKLLGLLGLTVWLLTKARSSTAMTCAVLCSALIVVMKVPAIRKTIKSLGAYLAIIAFAVVLLQSSGLMEVLIGKFAVMVGRDPTLHGRTQIWNALLSEDMNPLIGEGYYSFWSMGRMKKLSEKYYYLINEAHNGYIESYLNTGLIGLSLLIAFLASSANTIKKYILAGVSYGSLRFAFLVSSIFYGVSEAVFNRLSFLWMVLLLASMEYPSAAASVEVAEESEPLGKTAEPGPELGARGEAGPAPI